GAPVETRIVESRDDVRARAHDEDRLVADLVLAEGAALGDLLLAARHLPDAGPEPVELEGGKLRAGVPGPGNGVVLADQEAACILFDHASSVELICIRSVDDGG